MDKNVIQFPIKAGRMLTLNKEKRKMILTGSLASVLLMAIFINETLQNLADGAKSNISGRGLASVGEESDYLRDHQWEQSLAEKLALQKNDQSIDLASTLKANNEDLDQMAFVDLEGKYSLRLENGKVKEIEFSQSSGDSDRPKHINTMDFLNQHRNLWSVNFQKIEAIDSGSFNLKDANQATVGKASAHFDERGRLVGLKVEAL